MLIRNNGPAILASDYWETENARAGLFYLSINAGAFRLLVPQQHVGVIASELKAAQLITVTRGKCDGLDAYEVLFDDRSDRPWSMTLDARQVDRHPAITDVGRRFLFTAWADGPRCLFTGECWYAVAGQLPSFGGAQ